MITDRGAVSWGKPDPAGVIYLEEMASVAGGERAGIIRALKAHTETPEITILTDSMAAVKKTSTSPRATQPDQASRE